MAIAVPMPPTASVKQRRTNQSCTWMKCENDVQNDVDPVITMKVTNHQLPVNTFTRQAKKSWTTVAIIP